MAKKQELGPTIPKAVLEALEAPLPALKAEVERWEGQVRELEALRAERQAERQAVAAGTLVVATADPLDVARTQGLDSILEQVDVTLATSRRQLEQARLEYRRQADKVPALRKALGRIDEELARLQERRARLLEKFAAGA